MPQDIRQTYYTQNKSNPDGVALTNADRSWGYSVRYKDLNAYPFFYFMKEDDLRIGKPAQKHIDLLKSLPYYYKRYGQKKFDSRSDIIEWYNLNNIIFGRLWITKGFDFSCIIALWNLEDKMSQLVYKLQQQLDSNWELDIDLDRALFTDGDECIWVSDLNEYVPTNKEEKKKLYAIHLASQQDKNEFFAAFRQARGEFQAQKNREDGWGNATQAEVNFWKNKGLDENTMDKLDIAIKRAVRQSLNEATDRHRDGYWKERWAKQKAEKEKRMANGETVENDRKEYWKQRWEKQKAEKQKQEADAETPKKKKVKKKKQNRKAYYHEYNKKHPERLNRGFTKGYINGNVDDGLEDFEPSEKILGYDELGRPITNHPLSDMLRNKDMEWHDDDWCEDD